MKEISLTLLITAVISSSITWASYDHLCLKLNGDYVEHPQDCHKFIRCSHQKAYEFQCPGNLLWHHEIKSCDYPNRSTCGRVSDKEKRQNLGEIKENVKNLSLEEKMTKNNTRNKNGENVSDTTQTLLKASNKNVTDLERKNLIHNLKTKTTKFLDNKEMFTAKEKTTKELTEKGNFKEKLSEKILKLTDEENIGINLKEKENVAGKQLNKGKVTAKENSTEILTNKEHPIADKEKRTEKELNKTNSLAKLTVKENSTGILTNKGKTTLKCKNIKKTDVNLTDKHTTTVNLTDKEKRTEKQLKKGKIIAELTVKENSTETLTNKGKITLKCKDKTKTTAYLTDEHTTTVKLTDKEKKTEKQLNKRKNLAQLTVKDNSTETLTNKKKDSLNCKPKVNTTVKLAGKLTDVEKTTVKLKDKKDNFVKLKLNENTTENLIHKISNLKDKENNTVILTDKENNAVILTDKGNTTVKLKDKETITVKYTNQKNITEKLTEKENNTLLQRDNENSTVLLTEKENTTVKLKDTEMIAVKYTNQKNTTKKLTEKENNTVLLTDNENNTLLLTDKENTTVKLIDTNNSTIKLSNQTYNTKKPTGKENNTVKLKCQSNSTVKIPVNNSNTTEKLKEHDNTTANAANQENISVILVDKENTTVSLTYKENSNVELTDTNNTTKHLPNKTNTLTELTDKENTAAKLTEKCPGKKKNYKNNLKTKTPIKATENNTLNTNNNLTTVPSVKITEEEKENLLKSTEKNMEIKLSENNHFVNKLQQNSTNSFDTTVKITGLLTEYMLTEKSNVNNDVNTNTFSNNLNSSEEVTNSTERPKRTSGSTIMEVEYSKNITMDNDSPQTVTAITEFPLTSKTLSVKETDQESSIQHSTVKIREEEHNLFKTPENSKSSNESETHNKIKETFNSSNSPWNVSITEKENLLNSSQNSMEKNEIMTKEKDIEEHFNSSIFSTDQSATVNLTEKKNNAATTEISIFKETSTIWETESTAKTLEHITSTEGENILRDISIKSTTEKENLLNSNDNFVENQNNRILMKEISTNTPEIEFNGNVNNNTATTNIFLNKITEKESNLLTTTEGSLNSLWEQENSILLAKLTHNNISNNSRDLTETVNVKITAEENILFKTTEISNHITNKDISLATLDLTSPLKGTKEISTHLTETPTVKVTEEGQEQYKITEELDKHYFNSLKDVENATTNVKNTLTELPEGSMLTTEISLTENYNETSREIQNSTISKDDNNGISLSELLKEFRETSTILTETVSIIEKLTENITVNTAEEDKLLKTTTEVYNVKSTEALTDSKSSSIDSVKNSTHIDDDNVNLTELITEKEFNLTDLNEDSMELSSQKQISNNLLENSTEISTISMIQDSTVNLTDLEMGTIITESLLSQPANKLLKNSTETSLINNLQDTTVNLTEQSLTTEFKLTDVTQNSTESPTKDSTLKDFPENVNEVLQNATQIHDNVNLTELERETLITATMLTDFSQHLNDFSKFKENITEIPKSSSLQNVKGNLTELLMDKAITETTITDMQVNLTEHEFETLNTTLTDFSPNFNNLSNSKENLTEFLHNDTVNVTELEIDLSTEVTPKFSTVNLTELEMKNNNGSTIQTSIILPELNSFTEVYIENSVNVTEETTTKENLTEFPYNDTVNLTEIETATSTEISLKFTTVNLTEIETTTSTEISLKFNLTELEIKDNNSDSIKTSNSLPGLNIFTEVYMENKNSFNFAEETTTKENLTEFPFNDTVNLTEVETTTSTEIPLKFITVNLTELEIKANNTNINKTYNSLPGLNIFTAETTTKENNFNDNLTEEEMEKSTTVNVTAKEKELWQTEIITKYNGTTIIQIPESSLIPTNSVNFLNDTTEEISSTNSKSSSTTLAMVAAETISIVPSTTTTLAPDNIAEDPRLPFRSAKCKGLNNRLQFEAPKCYQYYQCFAGWAFLLNCHEGWWFDSQNGRCMLDENKKCK